MEDISDICSKIKHKHYTPMMREFDITDQQWKDSESKEKPLLRFQ